MVVWYECGCIWLVVFHIFLLFRDDRWRPSWHVVLLHVLNYKKQVDYGWWGTKLHVVLSLLLFSFQSSAFSFLHSPTSLQTDWLTLANNIDWGCNTTCDSATITATQWGNETEKMENKIPRNTNGERLKERKREGWREMENDREHVE